MEDSKGIFEKESLFGLNETVELLVSASTDRDWKNPSTHYLQNSLAKAWKSVRTFKVFEICKPAFSGVMLEKSDERIVSVMMPCRISVYEKADGKIYVSTINVRMFAPGMPESVQDVMIAAADEVEEIVKTVVGR